MANRRRRNDARVRPVRMVDVPSRRLQAAQSLWNEGRHADALDLYAEAIRQEPNNVRTYVQAARAYAETYDFDRMTQTHEKLIRRSPRHPGVHHYIGETFDLLKLPQRAIASFQRAALLPGAGPVTWMELASLYERAHRLDEAEELIQRSLQAGFNQPIVSLVQAQIQRRQNRLEQAEATIQTLLKWLPADSPWACQAWSELAFIKDLAGDFDAASDAIGALQECAEGARGTILVRIGKSARPDEGIDCCRDPGSFSVLARRSRTSNRRARLTAYWVPSLWDNPFGANS